MLRAFEFRFVQTGNQRENSCRIDGVHLPDRLFFKGEADRLPPKNETSGNFALVGLLYPAMVLGQDLEIEAEVSPLLLHTAQSDLQSLLLDLNPKLKRIQIRARTTDPTTQPRHLIATGFSAGIDTFTTLALFGTDAAPACRRISSIATFDVGAMGHFGDTKEIYDLFVDRLRRYAASSRLHWQTAHSNIDEFYRAVGLTFESSHIIRNAAAAFCFEDVYSYFHYSSSYPYRDIKTGKYDISFFEPILMPLLATETLQFGSAGAGMARYQKVELVSQYQPATMMLDTCVGPVAERLKARRPNCSRCWKCVRTMLNLEILGKLDDFLSVYDIEHYRSHKQDAVQIVFDGAMNGKTAFKDVIDLMKESEFEPALLRQAAITYRLQFIPKLVKKNLRTIRNRLST